MGYYKSIQMKIYLLVLFVAIISISQTVAQHVTLNGIVTDSLQNSLSGANVLAKPHQGEQLVFAVTDEKGQFRIKLKEEIPYELEISFMGFITLVEELTLNSDVQKIFTLSENWESLDEVLVKSQMAIIIKEDTIVYNVDKFRTEKDRKLRDVLKNLPGVEIDSKGRVTVNGKRITKLMIDDKDFFGGDTKLGIDNIPADVIESIEVLDNYSEVAFMKGLADSDKMALNIKLKKGNKNFLFGESRAGLGIEDRYEIAPAVFYYSPKTTFNFLGNLNNTGDVPLDYNAITRFKGGRSNWDDPIQSDDMGLYRFSQQPDARSVHTKFAGLNFNQELSQNLFLEAYSIFAHQKTENSTNSNILYLTDENFIENRNEEKTLEDFSSFNKIKIRYKPDSKKDFAYNALINFSNNRYEKQVNSKVGDSTNFNFGNRNPNNFILEQHLRYYTQPSYENTYELKAHYVYEDDAYLNNLFSDKPVFSDIIPLERNVDFFNINSTYRSITNKGQLLLKNYKVLSPFHHLYPKVGIHFFNQNYRTTDFQVLNDGSFNYFSEAGFDNNLDFSLIDPYIGLEYKVKLNKVELTTGLTYHQYFWRINQLVDSPKNRQKGIFLPEFLGRYELSRSNKFELRYKLISSFENVPYYANRLRLISFNQLFRGNQDLENSLAHQATLNYFGFNTAKRSNISLEFSYLRSAQTIQSSTLLEGIDQVSSAVYSDFPENNYGLNGQWGKTSGKFKINISGRIDLSNYSRTINNQRLNYQNQFYNYSLNTETLFKKWPNLTIGISQNFHRTKSDDFESNFTLIEPSLGLTYAWNGFIVSADYVYTMQSAEEENRKDFFEEANFSVFYRPGKSPFGFEIKAYNLFDSDFRSINYTNQFMVFDQQIFIQPRRILFSIFYRI